MAKNKTNKNGLSKHLPRKAVIPSRKHLEEDDITRNYAVKTKQFQLKFPSNSLL